MKMTFINTAIVTVLSFVLLPTTALASGVILNGSFGNKNSDTIANSSIQSADGINQNNMADIAIIMPDMTVSGVTVYTDSLVGSQVNSRGAIDVSDVNAANITTTVTNTINASSMVTIINPSE